MTRPLLRSLVSFVVALSSTKISWILPFRLASFDRHPMESGESISNVGISTEA
jgi:hypothetical protein